MIRSLLFVPGNNPSMLQNADVFGADGVIFDLEDSVHVFEKDNARNLVQSYLERYPVLPAMILVRINAIDSPFYEEDLKAIVSDRIDAIMLPKADVSGVKLLTEKLHEIEKTKKLTKRISIIPIIEKASSVLEAQNIASLKRVQGLLFGAEDYCSEMGIIRTTTGTELIYPRSHIAICCKAANIDAIDTPYVDISDEEGLERDCRAAYNLGLKGKAAIHPKQIQTINELFSPSEAQILWALKVLEAKKEADRKGLGVFSLDGKMIDKPIIERADNIRKQAIRFNLLEKANEE